MKLPITIFKSLRFFIVFSALVFSSAKTFAQAAVNNNGFFPNHLTLDQRTIDANFYNGPLNGTSTSNQWTVIVAGNIIPTANITVSNAVNGSYSTSASFTSGTLGDVWVRFDASSIPGHPAYLLPGESLTIQFTNIANSLTTNGSGLPALSSPILTSKNYHTPTATGSTDIQYQSEGIASSLDQCSPVNTNFYRWTYVYSLRYRNSSKWSTNNNELNVSWGAGTGGATTNLQGYLSNSGGDPAPTTFPANIFSGLNYPGVYVSFRTGLNIASANVGIINVDNGAAYSYQYPNNTGVCNFTSTEYPFGITTAVYSASGISSLTKNTQFNSYDYESHLPGTVGALDEPVGTGGATTTNLVCLGSNFGSVLIDNSLFNCIGNGTILSTPAANPNTTPVNNAQRWIRIVYGGVSAATVIPDIRVNGQQVTSNTATPALNAAWVSNPNLVNSYAAVIDNTPNTTPLTNGYVVPGVVAFPASTPGTTDVYGVMALNVPATATTSGILSQVISTIDPSNQAVGQQFNITIQYWNVCNPYPTATPVEYTTVSDGSLVSSGTNNALRIVTKPAALTTTGRSVCYGTATPINFSVGGVTGGATVKFYKDKATALAHGATIQSSASTNMSSSKYTTGNGMAVNFSTTNTNGRYFSVFATQLVNTCESDPIEVAIYQQPRIDLGTDVRAVPTPNPAPDVCNNTSVVYTEGLAAPIKTITAANSTNAVAINLNTQNVWSSTFPATVTITPSASPSATATYAYAISPQPATFVTGNVAIALQYVTPDPPNVTVTNNLTGPPSSIYTYTIAPQACINTPTTLSQNVYGTSAGGDISPATQTICSGSPPATITVAGTVPLPLRGGVVGWQKSINGGPFAADGSLGIANPLVLTAAQVPLVAGAQTTYKYQAVVQNGPCTSVLGTIAIVIVNPIPAQPTITPSGLTTFCLGGSVTLSSSTVNASSYQWFLNGSAIAGATAQTYFINAIAQSGSYTVQTIGIAPSNCLSPISNATAVTVNPLPAATGPTGGGAVCLGNPAPDIVWDLTTGTAPFTGTWTGTAGTYAGSFTFAQAGVVLSTVPSNTVSLTPPITTQSGTYQLQSLVDANGCVATSLGGSTSITIGGAPPNFDTAPSVTPAVTCFNGASTSDPVLSFSLDAASTSPGNYTLTYNVDGGSNSTKTFTVNLGNGDLATATSFSEVALNNTVPSPHAIKIVSILSPTGCQTIFNTTLNFTVNPLPAAPTGAIGAVSCSTNPTGSQLTVNDPGAGFTILWSTTASPTYTAAAGVLAGANNQLFTPTSNATVTYYTFTQNTTTSCLSSTSTAVTNIQDLPPAAATITAPSPSPIALCAPVTGNGASTPLTATAINGVDKGTWSFTGGVGGTAITSPNNISTAITGLPGDTPAGGTTKTVNILWTVQSKYGQLGTANACPDNTAAATININPLPTTLNPTVTFCEDVYGGGSHAGVDLTSYNSICTNGTTVVWYNNSSWSSPVGAPTNVAVSNGTKFYFKATTVLGCSNDAISSAGVLTFVVNTLPTIVPQNLSFCEDHTGTNPLIDPIPPHSGQHGPFDLTTYNTAIANGSLVNRSVGWFTDAAATLAVPTPLSYTLVGNVTLYAKVTNTITNCSNIATINLTTLPRPIDNPVIGNTSVCTGSNILLYQLTPGNNPGSTYTWSVVGTPAADVTVFGGGGTNSSNFFVLLQFPSATGTVAIDVFETLNGCTGNTNHMTVNVNAAPAANVISGATQVCTNQTLVPYTVVPANGSSTYSWVVTGATPSGSGSTINVDFGLTSPVTIQVTETASTGCVGSPANLGVTVNARPVMTSSTTSAVCSGLAPGLAFSSSVASTYAWSVVSITGSITGATVGQVGTGNLSTTFTGAGALKNLSGAVGSVTFNVTPTATAAPNCAGTTQSVVVTVNPEPVLVNPQSKTICSGQQVNYEILLSPLNLPGGTFFNWPAPVMSDASAQGSPGVNVPDGSAGTLHITDNLVNNSASSITATYTITPTSGAGCNGTARTVVVTVLPQPTLSPTLGTTKCSGSPIGVTLATAAGSVAANNYNITAVTVPGGLTPGTNAVVPATGVGSTYLSNDSYLNTTNGALTASYTVVPVSVGGCLGSQVIVNFTINPQPSLSATLDMTVCSGIATGLTLATAGGSPPAVSYNITGITIAAGLVAGGLNAVVPATNKPSNYLAADVFTNTGSTPLTVVYQAVPVSAMACPGNPPKSITITVNPEPVLGNGNAAVCSSSTIGLTLNTNGTSVAATNYNITNRTIAPGLIAGGSNAVVPASGVPAGYLASDIFTNTGGAALDVTYTIVPVSATPCSGQAKVITITINPEPVMANTLDATVCSRLATGLTLNTNGTSVAAASYNITSRSISGGLTPNVANVAVPASGVAANYLANDIFSNTGSNPLTVTYTVVPLSSSGCLGASKIITITINPEPVVSSSLDGSVCSIVPINLTLNTNGSSVAATTYNITAISIAGGLVPGANAIVPASNVAAGYLVNDTYSNTGTTPLNVTYTVVPISAANCFGVAKIITLTVSPEPVVSNTLDATICSGSPTNLTLNTNGTSVAAANYNISSVSVAFGLTASGSNAVVPATNVIPAYLINDKYTNTGNTSLAVVYTVVPLSAAGCPGPSKSITITINPEPVISGSLSTTVCSGVAVGLNLNTNGSSVAAANYNITARSIAGGLTPSGTNATVPASTVAANYLNNDVFTNTTTLPLNVTYTAAPVSGSGCLGQPQIITITINPQPVLSSSLNNTLCSSTATGLTLNTNGTSVAAASYNVTNISLAVGLSAAGTNAVIPFTGASNTYLSSDKFINTTAIPLTATYTVVPVSGANCAGSPVNVIMTIDPEPVISNLLNEIVCSDVASGLTLNTNGSSVAALNYNITARSIDPGLTPAGTNAAVPFMSVAANYLAADKFNNVTNNPLNVTYTVVGVSGATCTGAPKIITVTINPKPVLSGSLNATICSGLSTGLLLNTNGTSVAAQNYNITAISIAGGLTAAGTNATVPASGVNAGYLGSDSFTNTTAGNLNVVYTVVPVSNAGCPGVAMPVTITIEPQPVIATTLDNTLCSGLAIGLTLNTNGTSVAAANYNVMAQTISGGLVANVGNAAIPGTGVVPGYLANDKFTNTTNSALTVTYTVVPVSAVGCLGDSKVITMTINPEPVISSSLDKTVCSEANINLTLNTNGSSVGAANYTITARIIAGGLTPAGTNVTVPASNVSASYLLSDKFTNVGATPLTVKYTVVATSGSGCVGQPKIITITIDPEPVMASGLNKSICSSVATGLTLNTNGTSVGASSYNTLSISIGGSLTAAGTNAAVPSTGVANNYLSGDVFKNITNASQTLSYVVTPVSGASCVGQPITIVVTVNPEPVGSNVTDPQCATTLNHSIQSQITNGVTSVFTYTVSSDNGGVPAAPNRTVASAAAITDSYVNNTGTPANLTYTITPFSSANNCQGAVFTYVVKVSPTPVGASTLQSALCSRSAISINPQTNNITNGVTSTFTWTASYASGLTGGTGSGTGLITDNLTNLTAGVLNANYTVTPSSGACAGLPFTVTQPIDPEPVMNPILATKTICSNNASSANPTNIVLSTNGVSVAAASYDVSLVSQDAGLTGTPTTGTSLSANAIKNDVFNNIGSVPLKVVYQVTPKSSVPCLGAPFTITVTVNPEPVLAALTNSVCSKSTTNITLATGGSSVGAASYKLISVTVPATITADGGNVANLGLPQTGGVSLIVNDKYVNTTSAPVNVTYSILGISGSGCQGLPQNIVVTINPEPILVPGTSIICSGVASGIIVGTAGGSAAISQYNLKGVNVPGGLTALGTNAALGTYTVNNFLANDQYFNTTQNPINATYTIAPSTSAGCIGNDYQVVLTVNAAPAVATNLNATVCSTNASGIVLATTSTSAAAANYNITNIVISSGLSQTSGNVGFPRNGVATTEIQNDKFTNTNTTNAPLTVTYTIVPVSGAGCFGPPKDIVLTVEPTVVATGVAATNICSNTTTNIVLNSPSTPTAGSISFNYTASSSVGGQMSGFTPLASNLPNGSVIADKPVNNTSTQATLTYTITPFAPGAKGGAGCSGTPITVLVHVDPIPQLSASPPIQTICEGVAANIVLTSATVPSAGGTMKFNVTSVVPDAGLTMTSAPVASYTSGQSIADIWSNSNTAMSTATYTLQPVVNGGLGCVGNPVTITLNVNPSPNVTAAIINPTLSPPAICSNDLINISLSDDVSSTVNSWTASVTSGAAKGFSNGAGDLIFQNLQNTGSVPAIIHYVITPKASGCAGPPVPIDIEVDPIPNVLFTAVPSVCYGATLNIPLSSSVAGTNFTWTVDPNNSGVPTASASGTLINQVVTDTLTNAQDYLTYTITATGPGATACQSNPKIMSVLAAPKLNGLFQNDSTWLCTGSKDFLQIALEGQAPFNFTYTDGSSNFTLTKAGNFKSIQIQPTASTTYKLVSITDNLGCSAPLTSQVVYTVGQTNATFNILSSLAACSPEPTTFQYNQNAGTTYVWQWGDGNDSTYTATTSVTGQTLKHIFYNSSRTSTLKANTILTTSLDSDFPGGCSKNSSKSITVYAQLQANVSVDKPVICSGDNVKLTNQTAGVLSTGNSWFYQYPGDATQFGSTNTINTNYTLTLDPTKTNPQIVNIVYNATNGNCTADTTIQVTVYKSVAANFTFVAPNFVGGNSTVTYTNTSVAASDWPDFQFGWNFGVDATPAALTSSTSPLNVNYASPGPRDVTLTAVNVAAQTAGLTCSSMITKTVEILLAPLMAQFQIDPTRGCYPTKVTVTQNLSTGDRYNWAVIDLIRRDTVASSNAALPVFSVGSDGSYFVSLVTSSSKTGQTASDTLHFVIYPKPQPIFDAYPTTVYVPDQPINTLNGSGSSANQYLWDFGDGGTSTDFQPSYQYKFQGVDTLRFTAQYDHGSGVICSASSFKIIIAKQGGAAKIPNAFTPSSAGPSGGVGGVDLYNYIFLPQVKGVEEFNMQIYDRWGNLIFESLNQSIGWDGYDQHGKLMPGGVYVYKLTLRLSDQSRTTQVGDVTLIR